MNENKTKTLHRCEICHSVMWVCDNVTNITII